MAEAKEIKTYVHVRSGDRREFVDSVYKNLSKTLKALWVPADEVNAQVLGNSKSIPPTGVVINSTNKNTDEAHSVLAEVFDELGIAKPDGSILDMAITAAGALRQAHVNVESFNSNALKVIDKVLPPVKEGEKKEEAKTIDDYTKAELQDALNKRGIVYGARDSRDTLLSLLKNAD
jgi:hypothetical protein